MSAFELNKVIPSSSNDLTLWYARHIVRREIIDWGDAFNNHDQSNSAVTCSGESESLALPVLFTISVIFNLIIIYVWLRVPMFRGVTWHVLRNTASNLRHLVFGSFTSEREAIIQNVGCDVCEVVVDPPLNIHALQECELNNSDHQEDLTGSCIIEIPLVEHEPYLQDPEFQSSKYPTQDPTCTETNNVDGVSVCLYPAQ